MTDLQRRIAELSPQKRELLERRLAKLAQSRGPVPEERIAPRDRSRPVPLAFQQEREWAIGQFRPANNIPGAFRVEGELDVALLSRALTEIVARHEVLHSTVEMRAGGARVQVVHPAGAVAAPVTDLTHLTASEQREEVLRRWKAEVIRPFDRAQPVRLRASVLRMAEQNHVVLITTDHAAADLVSVAILVQELAVIYSAQHTGTGPVLPPLEIQYGDFAAWQREFGEKRMAAEVEHWRQTLDGIPSTLTLPSDRPFPARPTYAGTAHFVELDPDFVTELHRFIEREKTSLGVVLLAACSALLYRLLGQDDLVIGQIVSGRSRVEVEQLIGCFVTALPLRLRLADEHTLHEVLQQANHTVLTAYDHQNLPIDRLIDQLDLGHEASQTSLSHMWIDIRTPERTFEVPGLRISAEPIGAGVAAAPLTLHAYQDGDRLQLQFAYMTEMFDAATVEVFAGHYGTVLRRLIQAPSTTVARLELDAGSAPAPTADTVETGFVELFQRQVAASPHAPAVVCDGVATSYADLNRQANQLARLLQASGVGPETCVGILVDRSPLLAVAILGVLKAGGVYVPLDPTYPDERVAFMLADTQARVLITEPRFETVHAGTQTVLLDGLTGRDDDLPEAPDPASLAYVVYTSGSTGRPKGAMIEHRSLVTFAREIVDRLGLGAGDRFLQFASPSFDVLVEELFPIWLAGGAVVMTWQHIVSGEIALAHLAERERLTVMELPTAYWHEWVRELDRTGAELPSCLRLVIIGGERVLPERLALWKRLGVPLMHVYGLTETTVSSTFFRLDPGDAVFDWPNLPIGTPLPSVDLRILDRSLRPVPLGGMGELYIGGISLARGYLGRPGLTAQRFIADPALPQRRLYRTGDLVRRRPDGNLTFISRVDTQIKIRGFRVEPTEIESTLGRHSDIAESVVTLHEPAPGDRRLVAYVVPRPGTVADTAELRRFLEGELPAYMVPSAFIELDALPLTSNGKIDRNRLPAVEGARPDVGERYVAPQTPQQQKLAEVVAAVVGVSRIGIDDNFFEIGGDSILAIQVVARAQEAGLRLSPYDLFAHPTVAGLAEVATAGTVIDADQGDVTGPVPLAPMQRWFTALDLEQPRHWNTSALLELDTPVDPRLLGEALEELLIHHDGLRQRFLLAGDRTKVRIAPRGDVAPLEVHDLSRLDEQEQENRIAEVAAAAQGSLDLAVGPLIRLALTQLGGTRPDRIVVVAHRLAVDPVSMRILLEDLRTALAQRAAGEQIALPAKTTSWQSWTRRLSKFAATPDVQSQRAYWSQVVGSAAGRLPDDRRTEPDADTVASERTVTAALEPAETDELLRVIPGALNCRIDELLLAALSRTLTGWSGHPRHLVDVERHDRDPLFDDVDLTRTVGWFSVTHPLVLACDPDTAPGTTLKTVKETLRTVPTGGLGWQLLREAGEPAQLAFTYLGHVTAQPVGGDESPYSRRPHPIRVQASVARHRLVLRWHYSEARHEQPTMRRLADGCLTAVRELIALGRTTAGSLHTPSDFPLADVDQAELDDLLGGL